VAVIDHLVVVSVAQEGGYFPAALLFEVHVDRAVAGEVVVVFVVVGIGYIGVAEADSIPSPKAADRYFAEGISVVDVFVLRTGVAVPFASPSA